MTRDYVLHNHLNFISSLAGRTNAPRKNEQDFYFSLTLKVTEIPKLLFWSNSWVTALVFHNRFLIININLMTVAMHSSSETQGQSVGSGERAGRKFSSTGERAPGYWLSPNYFQKFKRMQAADWAQKLLCIVVPNRRTVSPEFFSWVRTRRLLSRHTCPVRSPSLCVQGKLLFSTFLTRNEGTTDESKKRLGCYQQEQFNLPREYSVFDSSQYIVNNRKFKMLRRRVRACLHGGGGPQVGEVTRLGEVKK